LGTVFTGLLGIFAGYGLIAILLTWFGYRTVEGVAAAELQTSRKIWRRERLVERIKQECSCPYPDQDFLISCQEELKELDAWLVENPVKELLSPREARGTAVAWAGVFLALAALLYRAYAAVGLDFIAVMTTG
jgi:hypothetical protein